MENEKQHIRRTLLVAITSGATNLMSMTIYPHFKDRFTYLAIEKQEGSVSFLSHNDFTFGEIIEAYWNVAVSKTQSIRKYVEGLAYGNKMVLCVVNI